MSREDRRSKIVLFSTVHSATDPRVFHKEARSLSVAGFTVIVVARASVDTTLCGIKIKALPQPGSRVKRILSFSKLLRITLGEKAAVYHFHDPELIFVGLTLRVLGKRVIYDVHENVPGDILTKRYLPLWIRTLLSRVADPLERWAANRMTAVIAATEGIGRRFHDPVILHNYPVLADVRQVYDQRSYRGGSEPFLAYFGTINRNLGIRNMVKALASIHEQHRVRLRLLGVFEDDALRSEILNEKNQSVVDYRGFVPMPEIYRFYQGALAGLLILPPISKLLESMPIKLFEFMACGIPVIASDFPLWRKIVEDEGCGLVVDPCDISAIATAVVYLLKHPEETKRMGSRGKELVAKKYNWESESSRLVELYNRVCQG